MDSSSTRSESSEIRANRLLHRREERERERARWASETAEPSVLLRLRKIERQPSGREDKDGHRRLKNRERSGCRGLEAEEQREARLQRMCITHTERMAVETEEQREARLQRMHANQSDRLAAETEEQKEARLQRMCANQSDRLAAETEEQREARLPAEDACQSK